MKNYSRQREEIIRVIQNLSNPTAEEIYVIAKQRDPAISRSTVYRNLKTFVEKRIITQIAISNGSDRYDYRINQKEHGHAICVKCGNLFEFSCDDFFDNLKSSVAEQLGFEVFEESIAVRGICNSCKKD